MEHLVKGTKVKIINAGAGLEQFNGQRATAGSAEGTSGETQEFVLTSGGALFLRHDQIERE
jgi:hypothetical protein